MKRVGFIYRGETLLHDTGMHHPECPERMPAILDRITEEGLDLPRLEIEAAKRNDLERIHGQRHIDDIEHICEEELPHPDPDTVMMRESWDAALLAAGAGIAGCKAVLEKKYDSVFSCMRPPGHHAEADRAMGFCLFNNIAIAAAWLLAEAGIKRVAILDWDVHHGNGTERSFYRDDSVYYASIHQFPCYPGTGRHEDRGKNDTNLNLQMPPGSGPSEWLQALKEGVLPEFERFDPEFLLISAGFDAHALDPLASQRLESDTFAEMTRLAAPVADGRIVSLLEGGYHLDALADSTVAHLRALQE